MISFLKRIWFNIKLYFLVKDPETRRKERIVYRKRELARPLFDLVHDHKVGATEMVKLDAGLSLAPETLNLLKNPKVRKVGTQLTAPRLLQNVHIIVSEPSHKPIPSRKGSKAAQQQLTSHEIRFRRSVPSDITDKAVKSWATKQLKKATNVKDS